jgi:uncharacterized protein DUF1236
MIKQVSAALAAGFLLFGASAASAADTSQPHSTMAQPASDTLSLTSAQRKMVWNDLHSQVTAQNAPSGFNATVGAIVPSTLKIEPVPNKVASAVRAIKAYDFAMVKGKLLIVNPSDKKIVEVITG